MASPRERAIIVNGADVKAILAGTKTQLRRPMMPQPEHEQVHIWKGRTVYDCETRAWCHGRLPRHQHARP